MNEILRFWPIVGFFTINVFGLGVMWWKVESARQAINILFKKVDSLERDTSRHEGQVANLMDSVGRMDRSMGSLVIRVDQIYEILTGKHK